MPYCYRNIDGDLLYFVHRGSGVFATEFGPLRYEPGDYVLLPKGTTFRLTGVCPNDEVIPALAASVAYFSARGGYGTLQNSRERAAAFVWRTRSCATACFSSATRSAASIEPCVGKTQAVGQRVIPLVRMNSAITAS